MGLPGCYSTRAWSMSIFSPFLFLDGLWRLRNGRGTSVIYSHQVYRFVKARYPTFSFWICRILGLLCTLLRLLRLRRGTTGWETCLRSSSWWRDVHWSSRLPSSRCVSTQCLFRVKYFDGCRDLSTAHYPWDIYSVWLPSFSLCPFASLVPDGACKTSICRWWPGVSPRTTCASQAWRTLPMGMLTVCSFPSRISLTCALSQLRVKMNPHPSDIRLGVLVSPAIMILAAPLIFLRVVAI